MTDIADSPTAGSAPRFALFSVRMLNTYGVGLMMLLTVAHDVIAPLTR